MKMNQLHKDLILKAGFKNSYKNPNEGFEVEFVDNEHTTRCLVNLIDLVVNESGMILKEMQVDQKHLTNEWDKGADWMLGEAGNLLKSCFKHVKPEA